MMLVITGLLFILGAGVGSFISVLVFRKKREKQKKSHCDKCTHRLIWSDIVPILSYILLKGKCRYCRKKIDRRYVFVEILMGCLFALSYLQLSFSIEQLAVWLCILSLMMSLFLMDLYYRKIQLIQIALLAVFCIVFCFITEIMIEQKSYTIVLYEHLFSLLPLTGLFGLTFLFSKGKLIGLGDILLSIPLAILLPWKGALVVLLVASTLAVIFYLPQIVRHKVKSNIKIPFGSFLILATILFIFVVESFVNFF